MTMKIKVGDATPWGPAQTAKEIMPGWYWVSTAGHGGYMVAGHVANVVLPLGVLSMRLSFFAARFGPWYCFEEDCCAVIFDLFVLRTSMDRYIKALFTAWPTAKKPEIVEAARAMIKEFYPSMMPFLRGDFPTEKPQRHNQAERELDVDAFGMCFSDADPGL